MPKQRNDLDPSVAFTLLLEYLPGYAGSVDDGGAVTRRFLADWYEDDSLDMGAFARKWVSLKRCPQCGSSDQLEVVATVWVHLVQDEMPDNFQTVESTVDGSHDFDDNNTARCLNCRWTGCAGDLRTNAIGARI